MQSKRFSKYKLYERSELPRSIQMSHLDVAILSKDCIVLVLWPSIVPCATLRIYRLNLPYKIGLHRTKFQIEVVETRRFLAKRHLHIFRQV